MKEKFKKTFFILAVNLAIIIGILIVVESLFRICIPDRTLALYNNSYFRKFTPYFMDTAQTVNGLATYSWNDIYKKRTFSGTYFSNNLGFNVNFDFNFDFNFEKLKNEKLVLVTGGSAAHGVGATSPDKNVAGQIEAELNQKQDKIRYRVLNLAGGSWVAFQEYLALCIYGKWFDPDWIIVMDGWNDIAVACAHSQGAGNTLYYNLQKAYIDGYLANQINPSYYRGWFENKLVLHSQAYRRLTGKQYVPDNRFIVRDEGLERVAQKTSFMDVEKQVIFYLHAQELILNLSNTAKFILSIQPITPSYDDVFDRSEKELEFMASSASSQPLGVTLFYELGLSYFMNKIDLGLKELAGRLGNKQSVTYLNMNQLFPSTFEQKTTFLIDNMHLNDEGHAILGKIYAYQILMRDIPESSQKFEEDLRDQLVRIRAVVAEPPIVQGILVSEASYGLNCRASNKSAAYRGNATRYVKRKCNGKKDCDYSISVSEFGDPARNCGKNFVVKWKCAGSEELYESIVEGEANEKTISLNCR